MVRHGEQFISDGPRMPAHKRNEIIRRRKLNSISSKLEYRSNNFEPNQFGYKECTKDQVNSEDEKSAVVWTLSPGARMNLYHEQEIDSVTAQLCGDIESLSVAGVELGDKHAFKVSIVTIAGQVEQECLAYITSKNCYVLGRNDYLPRSDFNINITMTCTFWSSDMIYVSGEKRYEVSAANIAVDPTYYVKQSWSVNTNNNTIVSGDFPVQLMKYLLNGTRWFLSVLMSAFKNVFTVIAIFVVLYALLYVDSRH